jgi:hypothetical protein
MAIERHSPLSHEQQPPHNGLWAWPPGDSHPSAVVVQAVLSSDWGNPKRWQLAHPDETDATAISAHQPIA